MAQKEITITLDESAGRDAGKTFHIMEMPAAQAEEWLIRALLALAKSGDIEGLDASAGLAGLQKVGIGALFKLPWEDAKPLYAELLTCVSLVSSENSGVRAKLLPSTVNAQVEEISTLFRLRVEVLKLHVGFLRGGALSNFLQGNAARAQPNT